MAVGALGPFVADGGEEIAALFAGRKPDFKRADLGTLEFLDLGALAEDDDFVAERGDGLGELLGGAALDGGGAPVFLPVPTRNKGDF